MKKEQSDTQKFGVLRDHRKFNCIQKQLQFNNKASQFIYSTLFDEKRNIKW